MQPESTRRMGVSNYKDEARFLSTQVIGEFADIARKKADLDWAEIRYHVDTFRRACRVEQLTDDDQDLAFDIAERYRLRWWDSQIVAVALRIGAEILYSEDMQDGQRVEFLEIRNPFRNLSGGLSAS